MSFDDQLTIPQVYVGKSIFITGGTGFIGKVLIEKLLRSCPRIVNIYLLMRAKKGKTPEERLRQITDLPLFDRLKTEQSNDALRKIKIVLGDVTELGLGLSDEDRAILINEVNIVFHAAASVRFDDPLKTAIIINVRGTRELVNLALEMKNLICLTYISTTYCQIDKKVVEEEIYPSIADWQETIKIVEETNDEHILNILTMKYIDAFPNTYTFAKNLAENVINDLCHNKIPTVIIRPSIVISSAIEPFPGWIDNFNGPVALLVASGKGILRSAYCPPSIIADYIPVDVIVKGLVLGVWYKETICDPQKRLDVEVFNGSNNQIVPVTMNEMLDMGRSLAFKYPMSDILWYPGGDVTACWYYHYFRVIFYHLLPALFVDAIMKLTGNKLRLMRIQQKIYSANMALSYFMQNEWLFRNKKGKELEARLLPSDYDNFFYGDKIIEPYTYFENACIGGRKYLMKEDDSTLESAKKNTMRMWFLSIFCNILWYLAILWILFIKIDIISIFYNFCLDNKQ